MDDNFEVQGLIPGCCSDFLIFEVSISNRPEFCADQGSTIENPDERFFWPPEGSKVRQLREQTFKRPSLIRFRLVGLKFFGDL